VSGAGAFGAWTALHLLRAGARVTLADPWGPGNSRSSSGDETRVIRGTYGPNAVYTELVAQSLPIWRENQERWGRKLLHQTGALWMAGRQDSYEKAAVANLAACGLPFEILDPVEGRRRFPQMNWDGLAWAILEKEAGYLLARQSCQTVVEAFVAEGGTYAENRAGDPGRLGGWDADQFVFACGPWLAGLFPGELEGCLTPTRQEIFYFGTPGGDTGFDSYSFPSWVDNSAVRFYGIPGNQGRGFKAARDVPGEPFDPTSGDRIVTQEGLAGARRYLAHRFPVLRDAPLLESRVCQYEMTADGHLIIDRLPDDPRILLLGGGSGHSFKFSPALGRYAAEVVLGRAGLNSQFTLDRFQGHKGSIGERK
jgi:glycine/D-amino acid oxidase-like deaminating enzyme